MNVVFRENRDDKLAYRIKQLDLPVIIHGMGSVALNTQRKLKADYGIDVDSFVLDDEYITESTDAITVTECNAKYQGFILVLGFLEAYWLYEGSFQNKFPGARLITIFSEVSGFEAISESHFKEQYDQYSVLNNFLLDKTSKESYQAFLNAKLNADFAFLLPFVVLPQYTPIFRVQSKESEEDFLKFEEGEVFVNCGAYNGDTIKDYLDIVGEKCEKIYALEPDKNNIELLEEYVESNNLSDRVEICPVGVSDEKKTLRFSGEGGMKSKIDEKGETLVPVDSIDNIVGENRITFINMDIEGAEMDALRGAAETIKRHKPTLAISAYHRRNDCIDIPKYIRSLVPGYKFYFRLHKPIAIDAVLYAVCK
jgi:FkbM family methyltransferase